MDTINTPGAIPDLEQGWQAIIKWKLKELSDKLVEEYKREMEECLGDNLPMEERNLMRIHMLSKYLLQHPTVPVLDIIPVLCFMLLQSERYTSLTS